MKNTTLFRTGFFMLLGLLIACATSHKKMENALKQNDLPLLKNLAEQALKKNPNDPLALDMLGKVMLALGRPDSAVTLFRKAYKSGPAGGAYRKDLIRGEIIWGDSLLRRELAYRALEEYTRAVRLDSSDFTAWERLGLVQKAVGRYDDARISYERALRLNPEADSLQKVLDFLDAAHVQSNLLLRKGKDLLKHRRYKQAMITLEKAVKAKPDNEEAAYFYHMAAGLYYFKRGSLKKLWDAIEHFGKASILRPKAPEPHFYMAEAYLKKDDKDFENILREYEEVMKLAPDSPLASKARKRLLEQKKREKLLRNFWKKK